MLHRCACKFSLFDHESWLLLHILTSASVSKACSQTRACDQGCGAHRDGGEGSKVCHAGHEALHEGTHALVAGNLDKSVSDALRWGLGFRVVLDKSVSDALRWGLSKKMPPKHMPTRD